MHTDLLRLASVLALLLPSPCWACSPQPLPRAERAEPSPMSAGRCR
jgi:hypothetical protein